MTRKNTQETKKNNPLISFLIFTLFIAPIVGIAVFMSAGDIDMLGPIALLTAYPGAQLGFFFGMVSVVPLFWGVCAVLFSLFAKPDLRSGVRFLGFCFIGTAIGLLSVALLSGIIAAGLTALLPDFEGLWLLIAMAIGFYLMIKAGPFFTKALFVKGTDGRFVIDNSYLYGGMNMPKRKKQ